MNGQRKRAFGVIVAGAVVLMALSAGLAGFRINTSPSLPMGLYLITSDPSAGLVEFCPSAETDQQSVERGYRTRGSCPDGGEPLLKPVIANAGDVVEVSPSGIAVNGKPLPHSAARNSDSQGRSLLAWSSGRYTVAPGTVWVASSYNDYSYDSRYFGPVPTTSILHRLLPIWTLHAYEIGVRSCRSQ